MKIFQKNLKLILHKNFFLDIVIKRVRNAHKQRTSGVAVNMPLCHSGDREFDSRLVRQFNLRAGPIAQQVEQRTENPCVPSSTLGWATS